MSLQEVILEKSKRIKKKQKSVIYHYTIKNLECLLNAFGAAVYASASDLDLLRAKLRLRSKKVDDWSIKHLKRALQSTGRAFILHEYVRQAYVDDWEVETYVERSVCPQTTRRIRQCTVGGTGNGKSDDCT